MNLSNQFLIASPKLDQTVFERAVVYVCQHDHTGAMGVVVNHVTRSPVSDILQQLDMGSSADVGAVKQKYLHIGGPVKPEQGFILHEPVGQWESSYMVDQNVALTTSKDILEALASGQGPDHWLITLGHAGWSAGQLEDEINHDDWLIAPCNDELLFNTPVNLRWQDALHSIGVHDVSQLSQYSGHA